MKAIYTNIMKNMPHLRETKNKLHDDFYMTVKKGRASKILLFHYTFFMKNKVNYF